LTNILAFWLTNISAATIGAKELTIMGTKELTTIWATYSKPVQENDHLGKI
jgi:hypothetical protein